MKDKKKEQAQKASGGGISFCGLLTIIFITLKLLGHITWPWLWVLAPLWMPFAVFIGIMVIVLIVVIIAGIIAGIIALVD